MHLWVRAEQREHEQRVGLTPEGAATLLGAGFNVTVEQSSCRAIPLDGYRQAGCDIAEENSWPEAPKEAIIFGLKELPATDTALSHTHIMFGHAYKGQADGLELLRRFADGGGQLLDLEYLTDAGGRRVAAFGYWAGFAGAAVGLKVWAAQQAGNLPGPAAIGFYAGRADLIADVQSDLDAATANSGKSPTAIVIGAMGRVGTGASDCLTSLCVATTQWDLPETAHGGPFPEILEHALFVNCILAQDGVPVFVPPSAIDAARTLSVIADVSCDPSSRFNPVPVYDRATTFDDPVVRVRGGTPPLDVTAIDNLPSMLPVEASQDFAAQLLDSLLALPDRQSGVWARAAAEFHRHLKTL